MIKQLWQQGVRWIRNATSALIRQAIVVYCIGADDRLKRSVRGLAIAVAVYAFSPIDLIPDFIPVLGLLDDMLIVPIGVWLVLRLAPEYIVSAAQHRADKLLRKPVYSAVGVLFLLIWMLVGLMILRMVWQWYSLLQ